MIPGRKSSQVTLANDVNNTLSFSGLGSSRPIRGQFRGWTDQWAAWMRLECFHCSQNPSLVVIIAGLTLSSLSGAWFLTNYPRCLVSAVLKRPLELCALSHENNEISPTDTGSLPQNFWQLLPYKAVTDHIGQEKNCKGQILPKDREDLDAYIGCWELNFKKGYAMIKTWAWKLKSCWYLRLSKSSTPLKTASNNSWTLDPDFHPNDKYAKMQLYCSFSPFPLSQPTWDWYRCH